ncbi:nucleotidyltransferase [Anaerocolumna sedimenticola]|uniref:tRNA(Met) cytidine acetate ligase n=1 Tax=Anaerocolumna sedimenticola TaxID=2696063 RepID=A0A6P1TQJ5_9FIRM|nr:nucleotidyltransferase [Anaerocolumna sedimenticola]QHQ62499.1 nucleotidyltransferase [Anaerocolumna sedimenticola]
MKTVGLITEYNPFHNGHFYHIQEAKRITGADYVVVVMSGNFVQRGAPAIIDKYSRTDMALACGADLILELPVCYATASAEFFAVGAISLLDKLGIIDYLCFGSECGDTKLLESIAEILIDEPREYRELLNQYLKEGITFPAARGKALTAISPQITESILLSPNNILGIEYIKAILRLNSSIKPITIKRKSADYHEVELTSHSENTISSATAIRKSLLEDTIISNQYDDFKQGSSKVDPVINHNISINLNAIKNHIPDSVYEILLKNYHKTFPIQDEDYSLLLKYKLMLENKTSLSKYTDISVDLANRIYDLDFQGYTFLQTAQLIKSKQWTLTRINRGLIHLLLNLYSDNFNTYKEVGYTQYARLLGFKKSSSHLIRNIVNKENIPVITKMADAKEQLSEPGLTMLKEDIFAANLYNMVVFEKYGTILKDEYTHGL